MNKIAGVILCGGLGSRLGGAIKPLIRVGGTPILATTMKTQRQPGVPLLISIGRLDPAHFAGFGADALIPDAPGPSLGPLAGLFAAAAYLRDTKAPDLLLSLAGDCPGLPSNLFEILLAEMAPGVDVVFPSFAGQAYPPNALWRFPALCARMDALGGQPGGRGPRRLMPVENRRDVELSDRFDVNPFEGINTPADLVSLARRRDLDRSSGT